MILKTPRLITHYPAGGFGQTSASPRTLPHRCNSKQVGDRTSAGFEPYQQLKYVNGNKAKQKGQCCAKKRRQQNRIEANLALVFAANEEMKMKSRPHWSHVTSKKKPAVLGIPSP